MPLYSFFVYGDPDHREKVEHFFLPSDTEALAHSSTVLVEHRAAHVWVCHGEEEIAIRSRSENAPEGKIVMLRRRPRL